MSHVKVVRVILILIALAIAVFAWWSAIRPASSKLLSLWRAYKLDLPQNQGRTNFLLLGVAGGDHDGADLTDTIIFASTRISDGKVTMLSVPRDIWVPSMKAKINTAYYYGEQKKVGGGFTLAKAAVTEITNQPIHYVAMINFADFEKIIDALGGVDIDIDTVLDDYKFPIPGRENDLCDGDPAYSCRYEHLHFDAGVQHMDGKTALKYVRSRQADGEEGTDFARSKRQEKLLVSIKDKLMSKGVLTDPKKLKNLYESLSSSITTDMPKEQYPTLLRLAIQLAKSNNIETASLSEPDQLYHPLNSTPYLGQWVLLPKDNKAEFVYEYVSDLLSK